jgi:PPOX class probable F420-dependent enzyme
MLSPREEAFLGQQRVARLATADADGRPSVVPVCYAYLDGRIYTAIDEKPKSGRPLQRLRNIEANPNVAFVCDRYEEDWQRLAWLHVRGRAAPVTDADERSRAIAALRERYPQYESMGLEERPLIRIEPESGSSWGAL